MPDMLVVPCWRLTRPRMESRMERLLVNLLQHEMVVAALFQGGDLQFNGLDFGVISVSPMVRMDNLPSRVIVATSSSSK